MAFSFIVEVLNMTMQKRNAKRKVVELNEPIVTMKDRKETDSAH